MMTTNFRKVAFCLGVSALAVAGGVATANADYLGEYCWSINTLPPTIMQFGITSVGTHFALTGKTNALGVIAPVHGGAELDGTKVRLDYAWSSPFIGTGAVRQVFEAGYMVLDSSLNGTVEMIDTTFNPANGTIQQTHLSFNATRINCN